MMSSDVLLGNYHQGTYDAVQRLPGSGRVLEGDTSYHFIAIEMPWKWVELGVMWGGWSDWVAAAPD